MRGNVSIGYCTVNVTIIKSDPINSLCAIEAQYLPINISFDNSSLTLRKIYIVIETKRAGKALKDIHLFFNLTSNVTSFYLFREKVSPSHRLRNIKGKIL